MHYTGVDVWAKWGIVTIDENRNIIKMLTIPKTKWEVDWLELAWLLYMLNWPIAIEDVHSIYWTSAKSNFNFGYIKWFKMACLIEKPVVLVQPKVWQKVARIEDDIVYKKLKPRKVKDTKATSLNSAQRLFPWVDWKLKGQRVQQDWLYDAWLMAYWLWFNNRPDRSVEELTKVL